MYLSKIQSWRQWPNAKTLASFLSHLPTKPEINTTTPEQEIPAAEAARIHKLCTVDRDDAALRLLHRLRFQGFCPDSLNISSILHALCDANRFSEAYHLLHVFISYHCVPDECTCNVVIAHLLDGRDPSCTLRLTNALIAPELGRLEAAHLSVVSYDEEGASSECCFLYYFDQWVFAFQCFDSLRKREFKKQKKMMGKVWEVMVSAEDIAEDMPQGKNVLEEFDYGQMIDSLCRFERFNGAARIVYMMRKRGYTPSLVSYKSIVHGLCKDGDSLRAYKLLEERMQLGCSPFKFTYTVLVEGLCREYDLAKAKEVLNVMLIKEGVERTRIILMRF
ncbi:hypothetical protein Pfo_011592 [Paulownia fortunei]|nr:hypothetical protein Pfo_011592 [Paulownia fortunei]